jgi:hypothetical protein
MKYKKIEVSKLLLKKLIEEKKVLIKIKSKYYFLINYLN